MYRTVIGFLGLVIALSVSPTPPLLAAPTGCVVGDCKNGFGTFIIVDKNGKGTKYIGQLLEGKRYGWGTEYDYSEKKGLLGSFGQDMPNYQGQWKAGKRHGWGHFPLTGLYALEKGPHTWRQWENGKPVKKISQSAGRCLQGDCTNGAGVYYAENGKEFYIGQFRNGKFNEQGSLIKKFGNIDFGVWRNGKQHGPGGFMYFGSNSNELVIYRSNYRDGRAEGKTGVVMANGTRYVGQQKGGKLDLSTLRPVK